MPENGILKQIPLPKKTKFEHNHQCNKCKEWTRDMIISYSEKLEKTIYICLKCQPVRLIPAPLPPKNEFRKRHECMDCGKQGKLGVLTYCHRCEDAEFICPNCITGWFERIGIEGNKDYDYEPEPIDDTLDLETKYLKSIDDMTDEELLNLRLPLDTEKLDEKSDKVPDDLKDFKPCFEFD